MKVLRIGLAAGAMLAFTSVASSASAQTTPAPADSAPPAPAAPAPAPASPAPDPAAPAPTAATTETAPPTAEKSQRTIWPWVIMGTGIVLVGTAAYFQIKAVSADDEREELETKLFSVPQGDPQRAALAGQIANKDDSAKTSRTTSLVVGTIGFLAIAGAVVLWFFEGGSSTPAKSAGPPKSKPWFTPSLAPGYAGAAFGTSF